MERNDIAVSIVIPMYNCGEMLPLCLESIRSQSFDSFEVIIVNNGSTDGSEKTARRYAREDERFTVINHPEGGAGEARNAGVDCAKGEYIAFVDGDDRLDVTYLEKLYLAASEHDADISVCGFSYYFLNTRKTVCGIRMPDRVFDKDHALGMLLQDTKLKFYLWGKLFRRTLFTEHDIRVPDMYYEDAVTTPKLFWFANKVVSTDLCGYIYTRAFSRYTEVRMTPQRANDYVNTIPMLRLFLERQGQYGKFRSKMKSHVFHVYFALPSVVKQCGGECRLGVRENVKKARAKIRLSLREDLQRLESMDLSKPVIE